MLRYNRDLWGIFFINRPVLKNEASADDLVDNPDDEELEDPDGGEEDESEELEDEVEFSQPLSADPLPFNHGGRVRWQGAL